MRNARSLLALLATLLCNVASAENYVRFANVSKDQAIFLEKDHVVQIDAHLDSGEFESIRFSVQSSFDYQNIKRTNSAPGLPPYQFTWKPYWPTTCTLFVEGRVKNSTESYGAYLPVIVLPAGAPWGDIAKPYTGTPIGGNATYSISPVSRGPCTFQKNLNQ